MYRSLKMALTIGILATTPYWPTVAEAAPDTDKTVERERLHFRDTLTDFANRDHFAFVVEGEPHPIVLHKREEQQHESPNADVPTHTSETDKIQAFGESYDYLVSKHENVYYFQKKYTYPSDIPGITPEECEIAATELCQLIKYVKGAPGDDQGEVLVSLVNSLSTDQQQHLNDSHILRVKTDLTENQRQVIWKYMLGKYAQEGENEAAIPQYMLNPKWNGSFGTKDSKIGWTISVNEKNNVYTRFYPIEGSRTAPPRVPRSGTGGGEKKRARDAQLANAKVDDAVTEAENAEITAPHICIPLREAVEQLNKRADKPAANTKTSNFTYTVDDALASKPVTIVGPENARPVDIASGIADVYGLRLQRSPNSPSVENITRLSAPALDHPANLGAVALRIIPKPLLYALRIVDSDAVAAMPTNYLLDTPEKVASMKDKILGNRKLNTDRGEVFYSAGRQLLIALNAKITPDELKSESNPNLVSLKTLDTYAQSAFAEYAFRAFAGSMDSLFYTPWMISHFDDLCFSSSTENSDPAHPKAMFGFYVYDEEKKAPGVSVLSTTIRTNAYPKPPNP